MTLETSGTNYAKKVHLKGPIVLFRLVYKSLHQDDKQTPYDNLTEYWNGDHILYTIYDIVLPVSYFFKPKI